MLHRLCNLPTKQSFFLFGPRGSGKSTLLKSHFDKLDPLWINLLDQRMELQLSQNPDALISLWKTKKTDWVVIDEVQKIPRLLDVVHLCIEDYKIKFALTGSSARKLKRGGANLLAGRAVERTLAPFSAIELEGDFNLNRAIQIGLLPKIWNEKFSNEEASDFLYSYVNTYLKEEIAAEQLVRNLDPFRRFLVAAAQSNGKIINHSAIEVDSGVARKQSERHFEILVDTLIGRYLYPFDTSIRKRQTKKAKFYFFDTGVVRTLQNLVDQEVENSIFEFGNLFETFLINEFFKLSAALQNRWEFSYFQTSSNAEIDLIIEKPRSKPVLIEIKSFTKIHREKIESFIRLTKDLKHEAAYVLSNDNTSQEIDGVRCLHWKTGLKEIFEIGG
jgi:predicted AAA+ superfamily ATPase